MSDPVQDLLQLSLIVANLQVEEARFQSVVAHQAAHHADVVHREAIIRQRGLERYLREQSA